jgi:hypothetical protein
VPRFSANVTATISVLLAVAPEKCSSRVCIYRLAIELGLLDAKYEDARATEAKVVQQKRSETARLQGLAADPSQWGGWSSTIHQSGIQKNRQYRAYAKI